MVAIALEPYTELDRSTRDSLFAHIQALVFPLVHAVPGLRGYVATSYVCQVAGNCRTIAGVRPGGSRLLVVAGSHLHSDHTEGLAELRMNWDAWYSRGTTPLSVWVRAAMLINRRERPT